MFRARLLPGPSERETEKSTSVFSLSRHLCGAFLGRSKSRQSQLSVGENDLALPSGWSSVTGRQRVYAGCLLLKCFNQAWAQSTPEWKGQTKKKGNLCNCKYKQFISLHALHASAQHYCWELRIQGAKSHCVLLTNVPEDATCYVSMTE